MTRLRYLKMTGGQRRDFQEHLLALRRLGDVRTMAEMFLDPKPPRPAGPPFWEWEKPENRPGWVLRGWHAHSSPLTWYECIQAIEQGGTIRS